MAEADPRHARILRAALDLPTVERDDYVMRECGDDAALLARLRTLLALDAETALPLDRPAEAHAAQMMADEHDAGARIGPYRLVRELGRGGMGAVWLAERDDGQFQQQVALKLIRLGMDSEHVQRQFRRERALLARLQHPNIAQLIDGGLDERGRPWFAMERIEGIGLNDWIEREQPGLRTRLELFAKLCRAVAHAHRQLVVHRDLKPSNVLVQADGEPRLLDFGIARLVERDDTEQTATMQRFLTRDFAAPEQLRGEAVGTSADVYALGLILFELLTGQRYRKLHEDGETTLRPSAALDAGTSATTGISRMQLRGDLDAITLRALAAEPARRYADAQQLADDVQRHLDGKPVEARPDSVRYRAAKFVRRNRAVVAAGTFGLVTLLAGAALAFWQATQKSAEAERARIALKQSESVRGFISSVFLSADPTKAKGADTTAGELLAAAHTRVAQELADEPEVAAELLDQIGNTYVSLGNADLARVVLREALAFNERAKQPSLAIAASAGGRLAFYAFEDGDSAKALAQFDAIIARLRGSGDASPELVAQLGKMHELKRSVLYAIGRKDEAREAGQAAATAWGTVRDAYPAEYLLAEVSQADLEAALGHGQAAIERAERALADPLLQGKDAPPALLVNARGARIRGLQALGRHAEAEPLIRDAISQFAAQYGIDNAMTRYWRFRHAETLHALDRLDEAQAVADAILALPPDGAAAYRRIRTEVLAAAIARERHADDAATRIAAAETAACGDDGNEELCDKARALRAAPANMPAR
ncbi:MAG: serine/threonine protein kinase [Rhodanobacteraceae bacterium]|jgi:serine/threonine-protein kinase|nr:serine/threonine protein kinase [Rhodanobacteraceae bacterium]